MVQENSPIHAPQFQVLPSTFNFRNLNGPATVVTVYEAATSKQKHLKHARHILCYSQI